MSNLMGSDMNGQPNQVGVGTMLNARNAQDNNVANDSMSRDTDSSLRTDTRKDKVLVGIFETENEVIKVITQLKEDGYREDEITVLAKDKKQMEHIGDATNADTKTQNADGKVDSSGKVGAGATIGAVLGGVAAALPALGLLIIPGIGPLLAAGPIAIILGGIVTGGVAGGLVGVLSQLGVSEEDAREYENYIDQGKILVLVENRENLIDDVQTTFRQNNSMIGDRY